MTQKNIKIIAKLSVPAENQNTFKTLAAELVEKSRAEAGNVYYSLNTNPKDPTMLTFVECWKDQEAIDSHGATEHFTRIFPQLLALCSGPRTKEIYHEIDF